MMMTVGLQMLLRPLWVFGPAFMIMRRERAVEDPIKDTHNTHSNAHLEARSLEEEEFLVETAFSLRL